MLQLKEFDAADYDHYPFVENFCGEIVPLLAEVSMRPSTYEGRFATVIVDGNGIQVMTHDEDGKQRMVFCRELAPFPLAVFVAQHLEEPLDAESLINFGFERFK